MSLEVGNKSIRDERFVIGRGECVFVHRRGFMELLTSRK
jgi:hypothetical protein